MAGKLVASWRALVNAHAPSVSNTPGEASGG
jgi:hypothetical protein